MIQTLGIGRAAGGSIYNSYLFTYIAITPFTGYLTDRIGARRVVTTCLLVLGLGVLFMGTVIGGWTPFYGADAILTHRITGILRDTTGTYHQSFLINVMMAIGAIVLISFVGQKKQFQPPI
jgi:MFS family permease